MRNKHRYVWLRPDGLVWNRLIYHWLNRIQQLPASHKRLIDGPKQIITNYERMTGQPTIGQLHDDVILLQQPESFSSLFSCAN